MSRSDSETKHNSTCAVQSSQFLFGAVVCFAVEWRRRNHASHPCKLLGQLFQVFFFIRLCLMFLSIDAFDKMRVHSSVQQVPHSHLQMLFVSALTLGRRSHAGLYSSFVMPYGLDS